jgi:hypothetical protein
MASSTGGTRHISKLEVMDDEWFRRLEIISGNCWIERTRAGFRGAILVYWQEALKGSDQRLNRMSTARRLARNKARLFRKAIENTDAIYQDWVATALGVTHAAELIAKLTTLENTASPQPPLAYAGMIGIADDSPEPEDLLILQVALLHVEAGGRSAISRTGPLADILRATYDLLPENRRPSSAEALVKRAENKRIWWKSIVDSYISHPKTTQS